MSYTIKIKPKGRWRRAIKKIVAQYNRYNNLRKRHGNTRRTLSRFRNLNKMVKRLKIHMQRLTNENIEIVFDSNQ